MNAYTLRNIVLPNGFLNNFRTMNYIVVKAGCYKGKGNIIRIKTDEYGELNVHLFRFNDEKIRKMDELKKVIRMKKQDTLVYFSDMKMNSSARTCQLYLSADDFFIVNPVNTTDNKEEIIC